MLLPRYESLSAHYPIGTDPQQVIREINPAYCDKPDYENTCAMRISKALNYCPGHEVPRRNGLVTIPGTDRKRYAIRVRELKAFMLARYGAPRIINASQMGVIDNSSIQGLQGIIAFDVSGWSDASGHFTLWDGTQLAYAGGHDYFNLYQQFGNGKILRVTKCYFWKCHS